MRGSRRRTESQRRKAQNQQEGKEVQDNKAEEQRLSEEQSEHLMLDNHYKSDSDDTVVDNSQPENSHRPEHLRQLPAQFCVDSKELDSEDDTLCKLRDKHEPKGAITANHIQ